MTVILCCADVEPLGFVRNYEVFNGVYIKSTDEFALILIYLFRVSMPEYLF
jgi:hypothetical protein